MKKYCLVQNGKIVQVQDKAQDGFVLIEADDIQNSMLWDGTTLSAPEPTAYTPPKEELLNTLIVTLPNNLRFYADPQSRTDIAATIIEAQNQNATDEMTTNWKTPDGVKAVTLKDLKDANALALNEKAKIIGVA